MASSAPKYLGLFLWNRATATVLRCIWGLLFLTHLLCSQNGNSPLSQSTIPLLSFIAFLSVRYLDSGWYFLLLLSGNPFSLIFLSVPLGSALLPPQLYYNFSLSLGRRHYHNMDGAGRCLGLTRVFLNTCWYFFFFLFLVWIIPHNLVDFLCQLSYPIFYKVKLSITKGYLFPPQIITVSLLHSHFPSSSCFWFISIDIDNLSSWFCH